MKIILRTLPSAPNPDESCQSFDRLSSEIVRNELKAFKINKTSWILYSLIINYESPNGGLASSSTNSECTRKGDFATLTNKLTELPDTFRNLIKSNSFN